jgi:hypothetical protein
MMGFEIMLYWWRNHEYYSYQIDNQEAFEEIHEEFNTSKAKVGFQDLEENFELTPRTKNMLKNDVDLEKQDMVM